MTNKPNPKNKDWREEDPIKEILMLLSPEVKIWNGQGRTDDQIWAVQNFLTGQGKMGVERLLKEAEERGYENGKFVAREGFHTELETIRKEAKLELLKELEEEIGKMEFSVHDLDVNLRDCVLGEKSEREEVVELVGGMVFPKMKECLLDHLSSKKKELE